MPWLQAFARGGWYNKMVEEFQTVGIPHPILINPKDIIVATGIELRGENLNKTLYKFLGK